MTDREEQAFRAAYSLVEEHAPEAPDWGQIRIPQARLETEPPARRRPALVAAAAALGVLLVVGGTILGIRVLGDGGSNGVAGSDPPTTTAPPATTEAAPVTTAAAPATTQGSTPTSLPAASGALPGAADLAEGWLRLDSSTSGLGPWRKIGNVVAAAGGFLAAGGDGTFDLSDGFGVVYGSADGLAWSEAVLAGPGAGAPEDGRLYATDFGYLIAGSFWQPPSGQGVHGPGDGYTTLEIGVWHSTQGTSWTWIPLATAEYGIEGSSEEYSLSDMVATDRGLLLLANRQAQGESAEVLAYTSTDGRAWESEALEGFAESGVIGVAAGEDRFVATGWGPQGMVEPRVWVSDDGISWDTVADPFPPGFGPVQIVAGGPGFVAAGATASGAMIVTSGDGLTWSVAEVGQPDGEIYGIMPLADGLVASGWADLGGLPGPVLWLSGDGLSWERVVLDPEVFAPTPSPEGPADGGEVPMEPVYVNGLFFAGDRLIAFGEFTSAGGSENGAVWVWTPPGS